MRVLKLFIVAAFAAALLFSLARPSKVSGQSPTEAPAAFDNMTNGFEPQGTWRNRLYEGDCGSSTHQSPQTTRW